MKTGEITTKTVRERFAAWMEGTGATMATVAKRCGYNEATISRYIAGTMTGDRDSLESAIADMLDADSRRQSWRAFYFDSDGTQRTETLLDLTRQACDICLVTSAAGLGKTSAANHYAATHESAILLTLQQGAGDNWTIIRMLFDALKIRGWSRAKHGTRGEVVTARLARSERLLIVDNAQRATMGGFRWLFDLHDLTGIPIALIGNPEILTRLAESDQLSSRIGLRADIGMKDGVKNLKWLDAAADRILAEMWPKAPPEVSLLAREAARQEGHLRRLVKQLRLAIRLADSPAWHGKQAAAFIEARSLIGTPAGA